MLCLTGVYLYIYIWCEEYSICMSSHSLPYQLLMFVKKQESQHLFFNNLYVLHLNCSHCISKCQIFILKPCIISIPSKVTNKQLKNCYILILYTKDNLYSNLTLDECLFWLYNTCLLKRWQNDEQSNHFTITKRQTLDYTGVKWAPSSSSFIYIFSWYRDQSRMGSKGRRCLESTFTLKTARPLSHPKLLPTGAHSTSQMQIRGNKFMSCFGWRNMKWLFHFSRNHYGEISQPKAANKYSRGRADNGWLERWKRAVH